MLRIVGVTGSVSSPSRTRAVVEATLARIGDAPDVERTLIDVAELLPWLAIRCRDEASPPILHALDAIEGADLLIVGTPVYKGSYTGMLKHLFDLLNYPALFKTPVGLIAVGGSDRHALVIEHELRPLFGFFGAKTLPTGIFLSDKTIEGGRVTDDAANARLDHLVGEAVHELDLVRLRKAKASTN
ncbi:NADPH-dependent FMN reductase [Rhodomicrobium vannielii ATCC 17100]|uniref:NADPH-dependent FMN reductase n=1 Tax=Rhodomicrobium vannielii (strain ATCC 17100 / DSM 162 / LMG 4299 / NCIMB 10020 / ATH 3.1.1) TaxID=648757 RepID=E3I751_RHOVT|nr:NAD(P)H-dependent oxidoreductase [Rhodomicrobium vannielii]ADP69616.1 NADPH-dependent FMN reductase [Rhodomicrobium vannielii ATCC 17100]